MRTNSIVLVDGIPDGATPAEDIGRDADVTTTTHADKATRFLALHKTGSPLLMPNAWDAGSARLLVSLGFPALATTSSGFAATLGRLDGWVTRDEALANAAALVEATDAPVSADLENGLRPDPEGVADTVAGALEAGLAGCSIEDYAGGPTTPSTTGPRRRAVAAARDRPRRPRAPRAHRPAENLIHGRDDLDDTIARLQAYQEAGADVLFAPGLVGIDDVRRVVSSVDRPVSVLALPRLAAGGPDGRGGCRPHLGRRIVRLRRARRGGRGRPRADRRGHLRLPGAPRPSAAPPSTSRSGRDVTSWADGPAHPGDEAHQWLAQRPQRGVGRHQRLGDQAADADDQHLGREPARPVVGRVPQDLRHHVDDLLLHCGAPADGLGPGRADLDEEEAGRLGVFGQGVEVEAEPRSNWAMRVSASRPSPAPRASRSRPLPGLDAHRSAGRPPRRRRS